MEVGEVVSPYAVEGLECHARKPPSIPASLCLCSLIPTHSTAERVRRAVEQHQNIHSIL